MKTSQVCYFSNNFTPLWSWLRSKSYKHCSFNSRRRIVLISGVPGSPLGMVEVSKYFKIIFHRKPLKLQYCATCLFIFVAFFVVNTRNVYFTTFRLLCVSSKKFYYCVHPFTYTTSSNSKNAICFTNRSSLLN